MNQKIKKHLIKSIAMISLATTVFTTATPHIFAGKTGNNKPLSQIINFIKSNGPDSTEKIEKLIQNLRLDRFDINKNVNDKKQTLLHLALKYKKPNIAKCLINYGANAEIEDKYNKKPYDYLHQISQDDSNTLTESYDSSGNAHPSNKLLAIISPSDNLNTFQNISTKTTPVLPPLAPKKTKLSNLVQKMSKPALQTSSNIKLAEQVSKKMLTTSVPYSVPIYTKPIPQITPNNRFVRQQAQAIPLLIYSSPIYITPTSQMNPYTRFVQRQAPTTPLLIYSSPVCITPASQIYSHNPQNLANNNANILPSIKSIFPNEFLNSSSLNINANTQLYNNSANK